MKKRIINHYLPMSVMIVLAAIIFNALTSITDMIIFYSDLTGYVSLFFLAVTLLIGPFNLITGRRNPISTNLRRDAGIIGGILAVAHSVVGLFAHLRGRPWLYFIKETPEGWRMNLDDFGIANYTGLLATLLIIILLAISNDLSLSKLKAKKWKNLQRTAYFMFILVIIHSFYYRNVLPEKINFISFYVIIFLIIAAVQIAGIRCWLASKKL